MNTNTLTQLRELLKYLQTSLRQCESSYKGLLAFRGNDQGIAFCTVQLHQAAAALREHAEQIVALAENLHDVYSDMPEQLALDDITMDSRV
jgi:hypothetical protein